MFRTLALAAGLILAAAPALAAEITVKFDNGDGNPQTWVFNDQTLTAKAPDGSSAPYTWDEANQIVCGSVQGTETCVDFEGITIEAGATGKYMIGPKGGAQAPGTATILSIK
jgi:hypothetical protein